ncbi:MAG: glycosyltransferase, partial [Actinomycetia bacterium]|nr:glycosyltransferase [Actinomycetes bacterium]
MYNCLSKKTKVNDNFKKGENLKICYIGDASSPHLRRIADYFNQKGFEISIITFHDFTGEASFPIEIISSTLPRSMSYILKFREVREKLKKINPDILHAHFLTSYGVTASLTGFHPLIIQVWGSDLLEYAEKHMYFKMFEKRVFNMADLLMVPSLTMKNIIKEKYKYQKQIEINPLGVDTSIFKEKKIEDALLNSRNPGYFSFRHFENNYRIDIVIKAFVEVNKLIPESILLLAGKGSMKDEIKRLVETLNLKHSVKFLGQIKPEEVNEVLHKSIVSISIPYKDAVGQANLES